MRTASSDVADVGHSAHVHVAVDGWTWATACVCRSSAIQPWDGPLDCRLAVARQHLRLDPRHRPGTHANLRGNLVLALVTLSDGLANGCLDPSAHTRATEFRPAGPCPGQPSVDAVDDHVPLELREGTRDGEQELTLGCGRIKHLPVDEEVH